MALYLDLKADHVIEVNRGDYFSVILVKNGESLPETAGRDEYNLNDLILPGKRIAGFGRSKTYALDDLPAGLGPLEAAESQSIALDEAEINELTIELETNVMLSQGLLTQYLTLGVDTGEGNSMEIPFKRPDVEIGWPCRGKYTIKVPLSKVYCRTF